ncbi:AMP-binding protein [Candidatus Obscuribacterales bacterium]|nr:AMP-binding protein [Candidatus Obscuribacterales bacterium]
MKTQPTVDSQNQMNEPDGSTWSPSYDHGVMHEPLIGRTIFQHIEEVTRNSRSTEALVSPQEGKRITYEELLRQSDLLALALMDQGVKRGDRVGIWSTNNCEWFVIFLAASKIGAILVNINPGYRTGELEYALNQSGLKLLFTIPKNRTSNYLSMVMELAPHAFDAKKQRGDSRVKDLEQVIVMGDLSESELCAPLRSPSEGKAPTFNSFEQFMQLSSNVDPIYLKERRARVQFDDPVNIQYTSGTTGFPKGVTLSHHNLINNGYAAAVAMALDSSSRFCVPMPFYHCGGMISSALAVLSVGGTVVIPSPFFQEIPAMETVQNERCTHMSGVPTMFIAQLDSPEFSKYDLSSLRGGFMAGAPCPVQLMRRVASEMHMEQVVILYGLTESAPLMTATTISDSLELRATTVGRIIPGIELKIVDPETQEILPKGSQGEILCRGHNVMLGYWNNPEATEKTIDKSGWLHSGDLGVMNNEGYLNITGRSKDMICRGGENVYPREIEEVLHTHPDISQAQVFGVPDEFLGEDVAMWFMVKPGRTTTPEDVQTWLKEKIAHFKVPKYIRVVEEFPMTVTGKIQKFVMRDRMVDELGLKKAAEIQTA